VLKGQIEGYEQEIRALQGVWIPKPGIPRRRTGSSPRSGSRPRPRRRIKEIENQLIVQTTEAEILGRRVQELLARVDEHERLATEREASSEQYRNQLARREDRSRCARRAAERESQHRATAGTLSAERPSPRSSSAGARGARPAAARDRGLRQEAETAWASERMETAVMRERINDVAPRWLGSPPCWKAGLAGRGHSGGRGGIAHGEANGTASENGNGEKLIGRSRRWRSQKARSPTASAPCRAAARGWRSRAERKRRDVA